MNTYEKMPLEQLRDEYTKLKNEYEAIKSKKLSLNMSRGKPSSEQLDLSMPILDVLDSKSNYKAENGADCRNYGELTGIVEAKKLFSEYMGVGLDEIIVLGNASLNFMYDCLVRAMLLGVLGSEKPWSKYPKIKFICPVPGYDRHFSITEFLGVEMINVPTYETGPDMDMIEKLVAEDETIKGMWCVPKFSNPLGITFSDETIKRMANLKPKATDFRIFYDNAYASHIIYKDVELLNILDECKKAGNPNMVYMFGSTSKITFPGAGVAFFAASKENIAFTEKQLSMQTIGHDKINMLRHVRFLKDMDTLKEHMQKHAEIVRPRFDMVIKYLEEELCPLGLGSYVKPDGGYFLTYLTPPGHAKKIIALCKEAGVVMTDAGATHPYGKDPDDCYIRIAPTFPAIEELENAMKAFCVVTKFAVVESLLNKQ
ncbi:aminotransferase class I/II-fold pyridoxal phosphate-dependent enzyme [Selenomonadales bacterium OttesenSCG-928-I06]|nr:aminotransferase class I/II-fold pyridoxal phosphate-dependent enzyme [Selenomonadales bacterium OttesenSCG-928-I06]